MVSTPARNSRPRSHLLRTLAVALAAVTIVGVADIAPANAWYDAYGYWHPSHHYYYRHYYWRSAGWRHHWWCEHHPYACGYRPDGYY
jgi:hypothetical protein